MLCCGLGKGTLTGHGREADRTKPAVARLVAGDKVWRKHLSVLPAILLRTREPRYKRSGLLLDD
jgi:hypothetical protein